MCAEKECQYKSLEESPKALLPTKAANPPKLKTKAETKPKSKDKSKNKSKAKLITPPELAKPSLVATHSSKKPNELFNPDAPEYFDFSEEDIARFRRKEIFNSDEDKSCVTTAVKEDCEEAPEYEEQHRPGACGCMFDSSNRQRTYACDKLSLQDEFYESAKNGKPYELETKLVRVVEMLQARCSFFPQDAGCCQEAKDLWMLAHELTTSKIWEYTHTYVPNY